MFAVMVALRLKNGWFVHKATSSTKPPYGRPHEAYKRTSEMSMLVSSQFWITNS